ncbi:MAG: hypothetical protein QGI45_16820 [Myxococcota bacterium]|jgi:hypothetical protein|nr:hypothetical protein [Myxococcota bacterium]
MQGTLRGLNVQSDQESILLRVGYWLLPVFFLIMQATFTYAALHRLWYEDLAESIRNVYWFEHNRVYNGGSTMVGWYGLVLGYYKAFGFSPVAAKWLKFVLAGSSWFAAAYVLKYVLGYRKALVPLCAFALSPIALYFNTFQYPMGLDLLFFPLEVCLFIFISKASLRGACILTFCAGTLAMLASMSYPTYLFYLPACVFLLHWVWQTQEKCFWRFALPISFAGFMTPFLCVWTYLDNFSLFMSDATHSGTGIFRGGATFKGLSFELYGDNLMRTLKDFFVAADSYYFYLPESDFSSWLGFISVLAVGILIVLAMGESKQMKVVCLLTVFLMLVALLLPAAGTTTPGGRRSTGFLMGFYVLFVIGWNYAWTVLQGHKRTLALSALSLLVVQHLWAISPNLEHVSKERTLSAEPFFPSDQDPNASLAFWYARAQNGEPLVCHTYREFKRYCRFDEIFAVIQGHRLWNLGLRDELKLFALTEKLQEPFALSFETPSPPPQ